MNILSFSTSNKKESINKELVQFIRNRFSNHNQTFFDMTKVDIPIYSEDKEKEIGIPEEANLFYDKIKESDVLIISLAEHNGNYTAFYKNLFDWTSRIDMKVYQNKKVIVVSTSPGPGGAQSVLGIFENSAPYFGANIISKISLPNFYDNFKNKEVIDQEFINKLDSINL